ncbi:hypothetical protein QWY31_10225 [Cytophagales bacterium LB-30]|uniref:Lipocalin-like domain-containing protein n=1 Tax=Shiella aurantiaca TaxID=3058365 RepID=A0ABT8F5Y1_9BACT|nr:hypothetical protein [Shiella aurantiaca]MDN4165882.1 hypothetical protein [Shiella aurantiaca]
MKKIARSFLIITLLSTSLTACFEQNAEQSTDPPISNISIVGEWKVNINEVRLFLNNTPMQEYLVEELHFTDSVAADLYWAKVADLLYSNDDTLSIVFNDNLSFTIYSLEESIGSGSYELNTDGSTLTLLENGEESVFMVSYLQANHLKLQHTQEGEEDVNEDGTNETLKVEIDMDLFKMD